MLIFYLLLYLFITLGIGWFAASRVKNPGDFMIAGGKLPLSISVFALFATWYGSETILGAGSEFLQHGLLGIIEEPIGAILCFILLGTFIAKQLYKKQLLTMGDLFRSIYGRNVEFISSLIMIYTFIIWLAGQLVALGFLFQSLTNLNLTLGIWLGVTIVVFYTAGGGMWAVSLADLFQSIAIIIGVLLLFFIIYPDKEHFTNTITAVPRSHWRWYPEDFKKDGWNYFSAWITLGLGSLFSQDVFQRVMACNSEKNAVRSTFITAFMYVIFSAIPLITLLVMYSRIHEFSDPQSALPTLVLEQNNLFVQVLFFGALLSAIISTAGGAVLAPSSLFSENIVKSFYPHAIPPKKTLWILRISIFVFTGIAGILASITPNIYALSAQSSSLTLIILFAPSVLAFYSKSRKPPLYAWLSMGLGLLYLIIGKKIFPDFPVTVGGLAASVSGIGMVFLWQKRNKH